METKQTHARCPTCSRPAAPYEEDGEVRNASAPFCSPRCKLIDLGQWLDGAYRIPGERVDVGDDEGGNGASAPS